MPSGTLLFLTQGDIMSPEVALLNEVWETVKEYIPKKERVEVAENVLRHFDENIDISELQIYSNEFDSAMKTAILTHLDLDLEESDLEFDEWE